MFCSVLALTNFEQARSIFPCYDEPEYKAIFTITIETSDHYHTISNMPIESEMHLENRMITQFEDTMLLSPNSLSFLITNLTFNCDADQTIFFYARQSELHTMDFSLETASRALAALKSYLDTNITLNEIKHVAVPSEDLLAKSFYGLITYRESLISFNAQSSPDLKKIQIAKMIAEKTAQQFFGHIVSDTGDENMWITKGLAKFLEYHGIMELDASFALEKLFVIEMLQPSLNLNLNDQDYEVGEEHLFDKGIS